MRATNGASRHSMIKRMKKRASGFHSGRHKMYRVICEAVRRADVQAFMGRKLKKRQFRQLWIKRISIACRELGITYSRLIPGLQKADIRLDRKQLSELAIHQPEVFVAIVNQAKAALGLPAAEVPAMLTASLYSAPVVAKAKPEAATAAKTDDAKEPQPLL